MSKAGVPRKVLEVYVSQIAGQEAEIKRLDTVLADYRRKLGPIDLSATAEFQKATAERDLQSIRKKNTDLQLQVSTLQSSTSEKLKMAKEMEEAVKQLTTELSKGGKSGVGQSEERVSKLQRRNEELDGDLATIEATLKELLQRHKKRS